MSLLTDINNVVNDALKEGFDLVQQGKAAFAIQADGVDSFHIKFASAMKQLEIRITSVDDGVDLTHPNVYRHFNKALTRYFDNFPSSYYNKINMVASTPQIKMDSMARLLAPILQKSGDRWSRDSSDKNGVTFVKQG